MTLTVGSLFSGVGGFDLGFVRAGFDVRWQCEIDRDCRDVLCRQFPETDVIYSNILTIPLHEVERVDVLIGGFPCQDLSVAGRRAGLDGSRSGLFFEFARVIDTLRPTFAVIENVPGLLSSNDGRDMAVILGTLSDIGATDIAWAVLDAQWFGVPQRRRRVFLVCDFAGERAAEILSLSEGLQGHPPPRRTTGSLADSSGERGWSSSVDCQMWVEAPALCLTAHEAKGGDPTVDNYLVAHAPKARGHSSHRDDSEDFVLVGALPTGHTPNGHGMAGVNSQAAASGHIIAIQNGARPREYSQGLGIRADAPMYTLDGRGEHAVAFRTNQTGAQGPIHSVELTDSLAQDHPPAVMAMGVRRLTPTECERLMGWPDGHTRYGASGKEMSDSTRYRMCGNGVVSNVAEWIARAILAAEEGR